MNETTTKKLLEEMFNSNYRFVELHNPDGQSFVMISSLFIAEMVEALLDKHKDERFSNIVVEQYVIGKE